MLKTDTANFNRFLTSLGLLLVATSLLVPYFFFGNTSVLSVSRSELRAMTTTGRDAVEARQHRIVSLEKWVAGLSVALFASGGISVFLGARRLRLVQHEEDEGLKRQARREGYEIEKLTAEEVSQKREVETRKEVDELAAVIAGGAGENPNRLRPGASRDAVGRIGEMVGRALDHADLESYGFDSEVKIRSHDGQRLVFDGLFWAREKGKPTVLLELKLCRTSHIVRRFADRLLALRTRYEGVTGDPALCWLVLVIPSEAEEAITPQTRMSLHDQYERALAKVGRVTVVAEKEILSLPEHFHDLFEL